MKARSLPIPNLLHMVGHGKAFADAAVPYLPTSRPNTSVGAHTRVSRACKPRLDMLGGWTQQGCMRLSRALPSIR